MSEPDTVYFSFPKLRLKHSASLHISNISIKYNIDIGMLNMDKLINYNHIINGISLSVSYITNIFICFISFIYMLADMDRIRAYMKSMKDTYMGVLGQM